MKFCPNCGGPTKPFYAAVECQVCKWRFFILVTFKPATT